MIGGCQKKTSVRRRTQAKATEHTTQEILLKGIDYLNRLDEFEYTVAITQAEYQFDRWLDKHERDTDWTPDAISKRGSRDIRESGLLDDLARWTFNPADIQTLQEAIWVRNISRSVIQRQPTNPRLKQWLAGQGEGLADFEQEKLLIAEQLFDWVIRNIQLEATLAYPAQEAVPGASGQKRVLPPQLAKPGPGYQFPPWEVLQYGYGDALQRSRVFIELGRQQGLDIVYLAFPGSGLPPRPRPWMTAVAIADELFLFDCELGLPIPTKDGFGIVTLADALDDPTLLESLDSSEHDFSPEPDDLKEILALIDVSPTSLSQRMKLVEDNLAGDQRTILTVDASGMSERLKKMKGVSAVTMWAAPFETIMFQQAVAAVAQSGRQRPSYFNEFAQRHFPRLKVFRMHGPLVQGRHLHLCGSFESRGDVQGAIEYYLNCRTPQAAIKQMEDARRAERDLGLVRDKRQNDYEWEQRLKEGRRAAIEAKQHSSYWIGLVHFESGSFDAAASWFQERSLDLYPDGPWTAGARYNLARSYEALGEFEKARNLYLEDDSPQQHGNLIRAKLLAQWMPHEEEPASSE